MSRTYDRATFEACRDAWTDFGMEWDELRRLSWDQGYPYPPSGTRWDDCEDDEPSQRAIVYRSLLDRPRDTATIVGRSRSWHQVVAGILQTEGRLREDIALDEKGDEYDRAERPSHREAVTSIAAIVRRIGDSL